MTEHELSHRLAIAVDGAVQMQEDGEPRHTEQNSTAAERRQFGIHRAASDLRDSSKQNVNNVLQRRKNQLGALDDLLGHAEDLDLDH